MMTRQRKKERDENYKREMDKKFRCHSLEEITAMLTVQGEILTSDTDISVDSETSQNTIPRLSSPQETVCGKKRRLFKSNEEDQSDTIPLKYRHIRESERKVRDEVYVTLSNLVGRGLSLNESADAIVEVANGLFGRSWKSFSDDSNNIDRDTIPGRSNIRDKMDLIETQSLSLVVDELGMQSRQGRMVTHAIDSTTKKRVGQFATQGIHVGQNVPFPLPLMNICGESTADIALQVDFGFEILAAVKGEPVENIYKLVDAHMTDSVEHNKGFAELLSQLGLNGYYKLIL